jgi:predicted transcriptional regulator
MDGKQKSLELKTRRKIYNFILKHPGLHERELGRQLNLPLSTLDYHLYHLKKRDLIIGKSDGHYTQFFIAGKVGTKDKKIITVLRKNVSRKLIMFLLLNEKANHKSIRNHLGLAASTTSFHLNKLVDLEIIEYSQIGRETKFFIKEPEYVSDLIIAYKKSFLDDAVDRFADAWLELNPKYLRKTKKPKK